MTDFRLAPSLGRPVPGPVVDPEIDGVFRLPPSRDARRELVGPITIVAALLLHLLFVAILVTEWRSISQPTPPPLQVRLVQEPPKPPPPPEPKPEPPKPKPEPPKPKAEEPPKPKVEPPKPPPEPAKPAEMKPRMSGADEKTEAAKSDKRESDLPKPMPIAPKAEEKPPAPRPPAPKPEPQAEEQAPVPEPPPPPELKIDEATPTVEQLPPPPDPKPTPPPRLKPRAPVLGKNVPLSLDDLPQAFRPLRAPAPVTRNLTIRLPSPGGGTGDRDYAGDAYLNRLMRILERNRIYPPAEAFSGTQAPLTAYSVLIEPSGQIVNITQLMSTGVPRLDEAAREMIANSGPFPPVPGDYPQIRTLITIMIPIVPRR